MNVQGNVKKDILPNNSYNLKSSFICWINI
jgi:hypothetical protein